MTSLPVLSLGRRVGVWMTPRVLGVVALLVVALLLAPTVVVGGTGMALVWAAGISIALVFAFPRLSFYALIFLLPLDPHIGNSQISAVFDPARIAVGLALLARLGWRTHGVRRGALLAVAVYLAAVAASLISAGLTYGISYDSLRSTYKLLSYVAFGASALMVLRREGDFRLMYCLLLSGLAMTAFYEFYQMRMGGFGFLYQWTYPMNNANQWAGRASGLLSYANSAAGYIDLLIPIVAAVALLTKGFWIRLSSVMGILFGLAALFLTQSRGGWIAAVLVLTVICLKYVPSVLRIPAVIGLGACMLVMALVVPAIAYRLENIEYYTSAGRPAIWSSAWSMFLSSPILGAGYGSFGFRYPQYADPGFPVADEAHNLYLHLLAETGVIGFVAFAAILILAFRSSWPNRAGRQLRTETFTGVVRLGISVALVGALTQGLVDVIMAVSSQFSALLWLLLAIALQANQQQPEQSGKRLVRSLPSDVLLRLRVVGATAKYHDHSNLKR